jgi:hypothetical protein
MKAGASELFRLVRTYLPMTEAGSMEVVVPARYIVLVKGVEVMKDLASTDGCVTLLFEVLRYRCEIASEFSVSNRGKVGMWREERVG